MSKTSETKTAYSKFPDVASWPTANFTSISSSNFKFKFAFVFDYFGKSRHDLNYQGMLILSPKILPSLIDCSIDYSCSFLKGNPNSSISLLDFWRSLFLKTNETTRPLGFSTLERSMPGNIVCSLNPRL